MGIFSRSLCKFGFHHRSAGRARKLNGRWSSRCRRCGVRMRRNEMLRWELAQEPLAEEVLEGETLLGIVPFPPKRRRFWQVWRRKPKAAAPVVLDDADLDDLTPDGEFPPPSEEPVRRRRRSARRRTAESPPTARD